MHVAALDCHRKRIQIRIQRLFTTQSSSPLHVASSPARSFLTRGSGSLQTSANLTVLSSTSYNLIFFTPTSPPVNLPHITTHNRSKTLARNTVARVLTARQRRKNIPQLISTLQQLCVYDSTESFLAGSTSPTNQRHLQSTMPFGKGKKDDEERRPSRLLNLNKSPRAQKLLYVYISPNTQCIQVANTVSQFQNQRRHLAAALVAS